MQYFEVIYVDLLFHKDEEHQNRLKVKTRGNFNEEKQKAADTDNLDLSKQDLKIGWQTFKVTDNLICCCKTNEIPDLSYEKDL